MDCKAPDAYVYVQGVTAKPDGCDTSKGTVPWFNHSKREANRLILCVTRQYREDECVPAENSADPKRLSSDEMWRPHPCGTGALPEGYDLELRISRVVTGADRTGYRTTAQLCGSQEYWRYDAPEGIAVCLEEQT